MNAEATGNCNVGSYLATPQITANYDLNGRCHKVGVCGFKTGCAQVILTALPYKSKLFPQGTKMNMAYLLLCLHRS